MHSKEIRMTKIFVLSFLFLSLQALYAQQQPAGMLSDGSVPLPRSAQSLAPSAPLPASGMSVLRDPATGSAQRAFGAPLRIDGFANITDANARDAAWAFIRQYRALLGVEASELALQHCTRVRDRWYVTFTQRHEGIPVLLSEVELRLHANGNVPMYGAKVYRDIPAIPAARIDASAAVAAASAGLDVPASLRKSAGITRSAILPVNSVNGLRYRLVHEVPITDLRQRRFVSYVDAIDGALLWRRAASFDIGTDVSVRGRVTMVHPNEPVLSDMPFSDMYVTIGGTRHTTNEQGVVSVDLTAGAAVRASFEGPWVKIINDDKPASIIQTTATPGTPLALDWSDANSFAFERVLFYHTNKHHAYMKALDPAMTCMDFQMPITVEYNGDQPNAMSGGDQLQFLAAGHPSMRLATAPMVLYHELGHSVNHMLYTALGRSEGMVNHTTHEGTADLHAALICDHAAMGTGVFVDDETKVMRNLRNTLRYPYDLIGEGHHDGQILSGAFWDLREATSLELVRRLAHEARYGLPDDVDDGLAFGEWFVETLVADDDDGDLSNGTPHAIEIITAFDAHNIGPGLLLRNGLTHTPHPDTNDTLVGYTMDFCFDQQAMMGGELQDVQVQYVIDRRSAMIAVPAQSQGNGCYRAVIPAQARGSIVSYQFSARDSRTQQEYRFGPEGDAMRFYVFLVDYMTLFADDFESDKGWTVGSPDDKAVQGKWERGDPVEVDLQQMGGPILQPADDHTPDGHLCFATGIGGGMNFVQFVPDGRTTLTSPPLLLRRFAQPVLRLHLSFMSMDFGGEAEDKSTLAIEFSSDNGATWTPALMTDENQETWTLVTLFPADHITLTDEVRVRLWIDVPEGIGGFPTELSKALVDDVTLLVPRDGVTAVDPTPLPAQASIRGVHPQPASGAATIDVDLPQSGNVRLELHDVLGRPVALLHDGDMAAGRNSVAWNGRDATGRRVAPGVYFCRMMCNGYGSMVKLTVR